MTDREYDFLLFAIRLVSHAIGVESPPDLEL